MSGPTINQVIICFNLLYPDGFKEMSRAELGLSVCMNDFIFAATKRHQSHKVQSVFVLLMMMQFGRA